MAERARRTRAAAAPAPPAAPPAPGGLRGRLPTLAAADADALRAFFAREHHWLLDDGGLLRVHAVEGGIAGGLPVAADGDVIHLRFDADAVAADDGVLPWSDHAGRARALAWGLAHEGPLARLGQALGVALLPVADDPSGAVVDGPWLAFDIEDDPQVQPPQPRTRGMVRLPRTWLERFAARAEPRYAEDPAPPLRHWRDLAETVAVGFRISPLSIRDWRSLRPGDVVVVGRAGRPPQFRATAAGREWPLAPAAGGWRVEGPAQEAPQEPTTPQQDPIRMSEHDSGTDESTQVADDPARNLPVRVAFEIGRVELTVGELADLQPGYVFALPAQLEGTNVTLLANGRAAGRGELVAVGDTLGVRLLSWT